MQITGSSWVLRSSALTTAAEIVRALKQAVLPTLPRLVPTILSATAAATEQLSSNAADGEEDVPMTDAGISVQAPTR